MFALEIKDITKPNGPHGRTAIYAAIKEGRLIARKDGRKTIILVSDYQQFLQSLPVLRTGRNAPPIADRDDQ
jgi:hypothetical protein